MKLMTIFDHKFWGLCIGVGLGIIGSLMFNLLPLWISLTSASSAILFYILGRIDGRG